jgi:hypothetical protein
MDQGVAIATFVLSLSYGGGILVFVSKVIVSTKTLLRYYY